MKNKEILIILDGFGEGPESKSNAITLAKTPNIDLLRKKYPYTFLKASGEAVGLTEGSMGGSEVGHFTIGAGRVVPQFLLSINNSIKDGSFFKNTALLKAFNYAKNKKKPLHLIGMISDKGVHSDISHLLALLDWAKNEELEEVYIHCIADGRDVEERSVKKYIKIIQNKIDEIKIGKIVTLIGRYYAMDRDNNSDRTKKAFELLTNGNGQYFDVVDDAINSFYKTESELSDYYLSPFIFDKEAIIKEDHAVIFFNYRTDRTKQLTEAFYSQFPNLCFICMGPYSKHYLVAFYSPKVVNNLSEVLSKNKIKQLRIAETEKYAHVTFFFNSQIKEAFPFEDRILVNSPKVASYADKPEMSAYKVKDKVLEAINNGEHEVIIVNFANGDLVGHSGDLKATIKAVEVLDECIGEIYKASMKNNYIMILTADHGNADDMAYKNGDPKPAHSMNPVIFLTASSDNKLKIKNIKNAGLSNIAPSMLYILGLKKPNEMTSESLIV